MVNSFQLVILVEKNSLRLNNEFQTIYFMRLISSNQSLRTVNAEMPLDGHHKLGGHLTIVCSSRKSLHCGVPDGLQDVRKILICFSG